MNKSSKLPRIAPSSLQDHGSDERLDRIWSRLDSNLESRPARARGALWWAPATLVIVFGAGVLVGSRWTSGAGASAPSLAPEAAQPASTSQTAPASPPPAEPTLPSLDGQRSAPAPRTLRAAPPLSPTSLLVPELSPTSPPTLVLPPAGPPEWQRRAQQGQYAAAARLIEQSGGFGSVIGQGSAEQLMILVEVARATGQRARAVEALRRVLERFPSDPNAPIAALTLGNLLEAMGDRAGAQKAFAAYRSLSPKGDFAEDALARQVEAATEHGDLELAKKLLEQYEKDFPSGRRLRDLKAQLAAKSGKAEPAGGSSPAAASEEDTPASEPDEDDLGGAPNP